MNPDDILDSANPTPVSPGLAGEASANAHTDQVGTDPSRVGEIGADEHDGVTRRELGNTKVPYEVLKFIPQQSAEHYKLAPLGVVDGVLEVGMVDPGNIGGIDAINFITRKSGTPFKIYQISEADFKRIIDMYRGLGGEVDNALSDFQSESTADKKREEDSGGGEAEPLDLGNVLDKAGGKEIQEDAPAIKLASTILRYAIDGKASDVHVEPMEDNVRVRYRVDGVLHTSVILPGSVQRSLVARIKVLASIRLDEKRKPQDGRFSATIDGRKIDFRVSTFPTYNGEKIVIRILDRDQGFIPLDQLGMTDRNLQSIRRALKRPHGLVLISGPTGSGKSTTLYSMLGELNHEEKNVLSLEDPIEYYIDGVNQSQVRPEIGYTFANGLRTTLRQDPDIIMVGEIRDGETAKLAIQAALTGHLVLSTIHTNSAIGTIPRLIDMGVEPYLIPPVLVLSMAQRLVRQLCPGTGKEVALTESMTGMMREQFNTLPEEFRPEIPNTVLEAERTPACPTGTRGRLAVLEVLEMSPEIEDVILTSPIESKIWEVARKQGVLTMKEDAMLKAFNKEVAFTEVNTLSGTLIEDTDPVKEGEDAPKPLETSVSEEKTI